MQKITLKINGMACGMCEAHVNDAIRANFGVKKVISSHSDGKTLILSEEIPNEEKLKRVINELGYELVSVSVEKKEDKKGFFSRFCKK